MRHEEADAGVTAATVLHPRFVFHCAIALVFSAATAATTPVLPRFVKEELGRSNATVGIVAGSAALGAFLMRVVVLHWGSRLGPRVLFVLGAALVGVALFGHALADSVADLIPLRMLIGAGQGACFIGTVMVAMDLTVPELRGKATTLSLAAVHMGIGSGPIVGEWLLRKHGFDAVWFAAATGVLLSSAAAFVLRVPHIPPPPDATARLFQPSAVFPGIANALGQLPFIGFSTFVALYGRELGMAGVGTVFMTISGVMVVVRLVGSNLPTRLGPLRGAALATAFLSVGLVIVATWAVPAGLYIGAVVCACGTSLIYPALLLGAVDSVPERDRASAVATFGLFGDFSIAFGGAFHGAIASWTSYRVTFAVGALIAACDFALLQWRLRTTRSVRTVATAP